MSDRAWESNTINKRQHLKHNDLLFHGTHMMKQHDTENGYLPIARLCYIVRVKSMQKLDVTVSMGVKGSKSHGGLCVGI